MVLAAGVCLIVGGTAGLVAGAWFALIAMILGVILVGGLVPWQLLRPYRRDEAARPPASRRNGGSLGFVPDLIERDARAREHDR